MSVIVSDTLTVKELKNFINNISEEHDNKEIVLSSTKLGITGGYNPVSICELDFVNVIERINIDKEDNPSEEMVHLTIE